MNEKGNKSKNLNTAKAIAMLMILYPKKETNHYWSFIYPDCLSLETFDFVDQNIIRILNLQSFCAKINCLVMLIGHYHSIFTARKMV